MKEQIFKTIIQFILTGSLGYCISIINNYKKKNKAITNAMKIMLQSNLTNTFFVYNIKKKIPDYVYKNWINMLDEYEKLEGDDYVHTLADKMKQWEITRTGIIQDKEK